MRNFLLKIGHFRRSEDGATLVEYGVAITLAVVVGTGALMILSGEIRDNMLAAEAAMDSPAIADPD